MEDRNQQIETLNTIRDIMERSSRFISLSGLAGVFAGTFALLGAAAAYWRVNLAPWAIRDQDTAFGTGEIVRIDPGVAGFLVLDGLLVLLLSIGVSLYLTQRKARNKGQVIWGAATRHLLVNLSIPLLAGGIFCCILFYHGLIGLIAPCTLIFYGLALVNAGKFTLQEVSYLGVSEIILGLIGLVMLGQGLLFWATGFGLLHIVYGILMYFRHDR